MFGNTGWYALRIDAVCNVLRNQMKKHFKPDEVRKQLLDVSYCTFGKALFYDLHKAPWPICDTIADLENPNVTRQVPTPEDRLTSDMLTLQRCAFVKMDRVKALYDEIWANDRGENLSYKNITIHSANPHVGEYNFYEYWSGQARTEDGSPVSCYAYDHLDQTIFGPWIRYSKTPDADHIRYKSAWLPEIVTAYGGDLMRLQKSLYPSEMALFFAKDGVVDKKDMPLMYRINPFQMEEDYPLDDESTFYREFGEYDNAGTAKKRGRDTQRNGNGSALGDSDDVGSNLSDLDSMMDGPGGRKVRRPTPTFELNGEVNGGDMNDWGEFTKCPNCGSLMEAHSQLCTGCLQDARRSVGLP
jgi:hypothetical protein